MSAAHPCWPGESEHDWQPTAMYGNGDCYRCRFCGQVGRMRASGKITRIRGELPKPPREKASERGRGVRTTSADGRRVPRLPDLDAYDTWAGKR